MDMLWVGRHNNGQYKDVTRFTVTLVVADVRTKVVTD